VRQFFSRGRSSRLNSAVCRTFNEIPPNELHPEERSCELTIILTNGGTFTINSGDLEKITCLIPGVYNIQDTHQDGRSYDLEVYENVLNDHVVAATVLLNDVIRRAVLLAAASQNKRSITSIRRALSVRNLAAELALNNEVRGPGRLTRNIAIVSKDTLAISYKLDGRKVSRKDAVRNIAQTSNIIAKHAGQYHACLNLISSNEMKYELKRALERISVQLNLAKDTRHSVENSLPPEPSDEPIAKAIQQELSRSSYVGEWHPYAARSKDGCLHIEAKRDKVNSLEWLLDPDNSCEVTLEYNSSKFVVSLLRPVTEIQRYDEIQTGDTVLLVGHFMVIAEDGPGVGFYSMTNYLRIRDVQRSLTATRRGMNRRQQTQDKVETVFC